MYLGDSRRAIDLFTQALVTSRDTGDRYSQGVALGNLGLCYEGLGEYRQAIDLLTQALAIDRDTGDRQGEGIDLGNLGLCYRRLGDYRRAMDLFTQALAAARDTGDRRGECNHLGNLGLCYEGLGEYRQAIDLNTQALAIDRDTGDRLGECNHLGNLGFDHYFLGEYWQAIDLLTRALAIARDTGYRYGEANALYCLGRAWLASGDARRAVALFEQAVNVSNTADDIQPAVEARSGLAQSHLELGNPAAALAAALAGRELPYPIEEPMLRLLEGLALLHLHRLEDSAQTFSDVVTATNALLALTDRNVAALLARALALSGFAAVTGDPASAREAGEAFTRAHAVTSAAGVAADTRRLLDMIACHDRSSVLAKVRDAHDA